MRYRYAREVQYAGRYPSRSHTVHIRQSTQIERDITENGAEDCRLVEDESERLQTVGGEHLHEARKRTEIMRYFWQMILGLVEDLSPWIYAVIIVAITVLILSTKIGIQP